MESLEKQNESEEKKAPNEDREKVETQRMREMTRSRPRMMGTTREIIRNSLVLNKRIKEMEEYLEINGLGSEPINYSVVW